MRTNWQDHGLNFLSVIIGVSLAFFINDYATTRRIEKEIDFILISLLDELRDDISTFEDYQIPDNQKMLENLLKAQKLISESGNKDSVMAKLSTALNVNNYAPQNLTFNSIVSSGKLDYISNYELRNDMLFYQINSLEVKLQGELQVEFFMDKLITWYLENPEAMENVNIYFEDKSFGLLLTIYTSIMSNKIEKYISLMNDAKALESKLLEFIVTQGIDGYSLDDTLKSE